MRVAVAILGISTCLSGTAADITAYTEEWPPYNFSQNGRPIGISTDLLRAACDRAGLACDIKIVPWARAYKLAQTQRNTLVFTTARTPEREDQFVWVGPILPRRTWLIGRDDSPPIKNFSQLKDYMVGVVHEDAAISDLTARDVPLTSLDRAPTTQDNLRKFAAHRVDFITGTEIGVRWGLRTQRLDLRVVKVLPMVEQGAYFFAMNLKSDPMLCQKLQKAMTDLADSGLLQKITGKYLESR